MFERIRIATLVLWYGPNAVFFSRIRPPQTEEEIAWAKEQTEFEAQQTLTVPGRVQAIKAGRIES